MDRPETLPKNITLMKAYRAIHRWYKGNKSFFEYIALTSKHKAFNPVFFSLIEKLPTPGSVSEIEARAVLKEIIAGHLEVCFGGYDYKYRMGEYAKAGLYSIGGKDLLAPFSKDEVWALQQSPIWNYLAGC